MVDFRRLVYLCRYCNRPLQYYRFESFVSENSHLHVRPLVKISLNQANTFEQINTRGEKKFVRYVLGTLFFSPTKLPIILSTFAAIIIFSKTVFRMYTQQIEIFTKRAKKKKKKGENKIVDILSHSGPT